MPLILTVADVKKILRYGRTNSYGAIKHIKDEYPASRKLIGSKVRTQDFAHAYDFTIEEVEKALKS